MVIMLLSVMGVLLFPWQAQAALPLLKMLSTPSCSACARMSRVLDDLLQDYDGKLAVEKVNLREHLDIAKQHNVKYVPHMLFLDADGNIVKEEVGALTREKVLQTFQDAGVSIG